MITIPAWTLFGLTVLLVVWQALITVHAKFMRDNLADLHKAIDALRGTEEDGPS